MTTTFSVEAPPVAAATAVAFADDGDGILAINDNSAAIYGNAAETTRAWRTIADPPAKLKYVARCGTSYVGTNGTGWWAYVETDGTWEERDAPFDPPATLLVGTDQCGATDGTDWWSSADGGTTWDKKARLGTLPDGVIAGSQVGSALLVTNGTDYWRSGDMGDQWTSIQNPPPQDVRPVLVEDSFVFAGGQWYTDEADPAGAWTATDRLGKLTITAPTAAGLTTDPSLVVTNGADWESVDLQTTQAVNFPAPPLR